MLVSLYFEKLIVIFGDEFVRLVVVGGFVVVVGLRVVL